MSAFDEAQKKVAQQKPAINQPVNDGNRLTDNSQVAYNAVFHELESAKHHQRELADQVWPLVQSVRNGDFFFERLAENMAENPTARQFSLFNSSEDNNFFRSRLKDITGIKTAPKEIKASKGFNPVS